MDPRDFLNQFDKDFQLESIPESEKLLPPPKQSDNQQFSNFQFDPNKKDDFNSNFSLSGLNDSSHFDTSNIAPGNLQFPQYQAESPIMKKPLPNLDDIPNAGQYLNPRSPLNIPQPSDEDPEIQNLSNSPPYSKMNQNIDQYPNFAQTTTQNAQQQSFNINQQQQQNIQQQSPQLITSTRPAPKQFSVPSFSYSSMNVPSTPQSHISLQPDEISSSPIQPINASQISTPIQNNNNNNGIPNTTPTASTTIPTNMPLLKPNTSTLSSLTNGNSTTTTTTSTTTATNNDNNQSFSSSQSKRSSFQSSPETINMLRTIQDLRRERVKDAEKLKNLMTENARLQAKLTMLEHTDVKVAELGSKVEQLLQDYLENEQVRAQQAALVTQLRQEVIILKSRIAAAQPQPKPRGRFD